MVHKKGAIQLNLFGEEADVLESYENAEIPNERSCNMVSSNLKDNFRKYDIPFIGCDFVSVYPLISRVVPKEKVLFSDFDTDTAIMCEIVCAAICHQINWDFLREVVYKYTKTEPDWILPHNLAIIDYRQVKSMLGTYHKIENIKAKERASILQSLGKWSAHYQEIRDVFLDKSGALKPQKQVLTTLQKCQVFSTDPEGKKMNLLLQKLGTIKELHGIDCYAKPAIDYHLLRLYLRRGLLFARTKLALDYISNPDIERKESTVAAVRELCSGLLSQISLFTGLSVAEVNNIEWHVARSVCQREHPDCELNGEKAVWLRAEFKECPFRHTCMACNSSAGELMFVKEPSYKGTSY